MLDTSTKKRIDDCRDILVGKLPDPKAQIEQITIGLIYKFMDDMDKEAIEMGGEAKFFSGDFEKYSWNSLFDTKVTATEMLGLYSEAIVSMDKNPKIPQLFRDIFKNAYLPYRDPETLKMFLKTIGEFEYTHSEMLGDAFEYLLSVMGSQGDAGQFRTPRHIIDFLVAVVDPKKTDTILDPACGTAGFLISAFKHIMGGDGTTTLTPDERKRIIGNCTGYDISPDMVRLSLVNLYLHGFSDPHISEYDTLSSEERWDENFDVILANPPFMSPKGGIRPHKRFTISSNRSEVLFVDYIAEHLNPKGRAGIIVPEGVIFQSGTAYKELRKMLVENYLYAVVSLPAGIFNPYSGVKTSILLMDKEISKKSNEILFVKVANDGFNLGAQRNAVKGGQLDDAIEIIREFVASVNESATKTTIVKTATTDAKPTHATVETQCIASLPTTASLPHANNTTKLGIPTTASLPHANTNPEYANIAHAVPKSVIAKNGDYNLSGERYKVTRNIDLSEYPNVTLGECCNILNGSTPSKTNKDFWTNGNIPWFTIDDIRKDGRIINNTVQKITDKALNETSVKLLPANTVLLCCTASVGEYAFAEISLTTNQQFNGLAVKDDFREKLLPKFLYYLSSTFKEELIRISGQTSFNFVSVAVLKTLQIVIPPISVQEEIVAEIEAYQKIIDGAKMVVSNYKPKIDIDPEWEIVEFSEAPLEIIDGDRGINYPNGNDFSTEGYCLFLNTKNVRDNGFRFDEVMFISKEKDQLLRKGKLQREDVLLTTRGTIGNTAYYDSSINYENIRINSGMLIFRPNNQILLSEYLYYFFQSENCQVQFSNIISGSAQPQLPIRDLKFAKIPIPTIELQRKVVDQIKKELFLVNASKQLIEIFEQKIKDRIAKVWGSSTTPTAN